MYTALARRVTLGLARTGTTGNGYGNPIGVGEAGRIAQAFRPLLRFDQVATAEFYDDAGFCQDCAAPYCYRHWHVSETGYGHCPPRSRQEPGPALADCRPAR